MKWAETDPDRTALVDRSGRISYGELAEVVEERAEALSRDVAVGHLFPIRVTLDNSTVVELFAAQVAGGVPLPYTTVVPDQNDVPGPFDVIAVPTSGSTGLPRTVRLTDANIDASVAASRARHDTTAADCWLLCLPLNHVGGLSVLWRSFEAGGSVAISPFDDDLPSFMATANPTVASMVPTMVHRLIESNPSALTALRFVLVGGAAMSETLVRTADSLGVRIIQTYGMTETTSQVATAPRSTRGGAKILDGFLIEILDPQGLPVPVGETGLITIDGPAVSPGYLGEAARVGAFKTTDLGYLNADRSVSVLGRADDIVITGGENVSLAKVGDAIIGFEGVSDAVAIGLPDDEWGTAVAAVVATGLSEHVLSELARKVLAPYERPRQWVVVDRIPLLENGKHDLATLRALAGMNPASS